MDVIKLFNEICGISHCSFHTQKLADYFNVSLEYLMTGEEKKGEKNTT